MKSRHLRRGSKGCGRQTEFYLSNLLNCFPLPRVSIGWWFFLGNGVADNGHSRSCPVPSPNLSDEPSCTATWRQTLDGKDLTDTTYVVFEPRRRGPMHRIPALALPPAHPLQSPRGVVRLAISDATKKRFMTWERCNYYPATVTRKRLMYEIFPVTQIIREQTDAACCSCGVKTSCTTSGRY